MPSGLPAASRARPRPAPHRRPASIASAWSGASARGSESAKASRSRVFAAAGLQQYAFWANGSASSGLPSVEQHGARCSSAIGPAGCRRAAAASIAVRRLAARARPFPRLHQRREQVDLGRRRALFADRRRASLGLAAREAHRRPASAGRRSAVGRPESLGQRSASSAWPDWIAVAMARRAMVRSAGSAARHRREQPRRAGLVAVHLGRARLDIGRQRHRAAVAVPEPAQRRRPAPATAGAIITCSGNWVLHRLRERPS